MTTISMDCSITYCMKRILMYSRDCLSVTFPIITVRSPENNSKLGLEQKC